MNFRFLASSIVAISIVFGKGDLSGQSIRTENDFYAERLSQILEFTIPTYNDHFSSIKFNDTRALVDSLIFHFDHLSASDQQDARYVINQYNYFYTDLLRSEKVYADSLFYKIEKSNSEHPILDKKRPFLNYFYNTPHHLYQLIRPKFSLVVDPILDVNASYDLESKTGLFQNTRGAKVTGYIDKKVYFFTQILETQARFPNYVDDFIDSNLAIPGNGYYKVYESSVIDNLTGRDFLNASGYLGIPISKSISLDFGHGKHFIGNGMRSLLLSDFTNNYFYLKLNTKVWKFHYQNIFAELSALGSNDISSDVLIPKKYMASHYLTFKPAKHLEIGLFESVIFSRENHFEFQYLNPVIFYRSIEQSLGSPDNAMLGLNINWTLFNKVKLYGQIVVDEFKLSQLNTGWWGNKFGGQFGLLYLNAFNIPNLDVQVETNWVRPFTYAQSRSIEAKPEYTITSFSHFNQPLAHPLGANFKEFIFRVNYRPVPDLRFDLTFMHFNKGLNRQMDNYGGNILLNTESYFQEFDNKIGQGVEEDVNLIQLRTSYHLYPNLYLDLNTIYRNSTVTTNDGFNSLLSLGLGIRYQINPTNIQI